MTIMICHRCDYTIHYVGQKECPSCGVRINDWRVKAIIKQEDDEADVNDWRKK